MKYIRTIFTASFIFIISVVPIAAQDFSVGADIVNRYIWRGLDLGLGRGYDAEASSPFIQPNVALTAGGFVAGFWGSYALSNSTALEEIDFYLSYTFAIENAGGFSIGFTDYMNPNTPAGFSNFDNYDKDSDGDGNFGGAHFVELNAGYSGPEEFPISLSFNVFLHNVVDNPVYIQLGYTTSVNDIGVNLFAGGTPEKVSADDPGYYTSDAAITNVGFTLSKSITITESFSLPIYGSVILNPAADHMFYVVGLKF